jgi:cytochrome c oxidase assembly protein subunit 11
MRDRARRAADKNIRRTAYACAGLALSMVGLAYAAVPLYDLFCKVTGYDGTPVVGRGPSGGVIDRRITVRFDANVAPGLGWRFAPEAAQIELRLGETATVFYKVRNEGRNAATGIATFNVQPGQAGAHFVKLQCFCFVEQTLAAGETMEYPVAFYVEPGLAADPSLKDLREITLSYTYFPSRNGQPLATSSAAAATPDR